MFCTNCGEQMRDTDKFCAECGASASPRTARKRAVDGVAMEPPIPPRTPQSTAEAYHAPLPATPPGARSAGQPELAFSPAQQTPPMAAPPIRQAPPPPLSDQQQQQVLLEAEEIASVRGMTPIEVLPEIVPATARKSAPQAIAQTCSVCGRVNPAENYFCEGCGRALQAASARPVPSPITQTSWLDNNASPSRPVAAPAAPPVATSAAPAPAPAPATATDNNFFYYYDDKASHRGNRKLLIVLLVVLVLAIGGVAYLMLRPSAKSASGADVTVTIVPTEARVAARGTQDFAATVKGTGDIDVTWSVAEGSAGGTLVNRGAQAEGGSVATMAIYAAPTTPGTYHVVATSKADPAKSATAEVTVTER